MSEAEEFLDEGCGHARAEEHCSKCDIDQIFDPLHAPGTGVKTVLDAFIALGADRLMHRESGFGIAHNPCPGVM